MSVSTRLEVSLTEPPRLSCAYCGESWPLWPDPQEFWQFTKDKGVNLARCLACIRERARLREAMRRLDAEYRRRDAAKVKRYRKALARAYPELVQVYEREKRERRRAWLNAYRQAQEERVEACACGLTLRARGEADLGRVVRRHQQTLRHQAWRNQQEAAA